jgi:predicted transcriptional regulator
LKAKQELAELTAQQGIDNMNLESLAQNKDAKILQLEKQLADLSGDDTATQLQSRLSSLSSEKDQLTLKIQELIGQNQELMNRIEKTPVRIVEVHK